MAASYLILAQNNVQDLFEFEIYPFWVYANHALGDQRDLASRFWHLWWAWRLPRRRSALRRLAARNDRAQAPFLARPLETQGMIKRISEILEAHDKWLSTSYGGWDIQTAPSIVVTETPFGGKHAGYYGWEDAENRLAIITIANWQRNLAPPSILEFILTTVQRYSLRLAFPSSVGSHYPTRACISDFNANLEDIRPGILVGYLCNECEEALSGAAKPQEINGIKTFIRNTWIGRTEDPGTVASNLKRIYGYDLDRTKGLSPSLRDLIFTTLTSEATKWIITALLAGLLGWFLARTSTPKRDIPANPQRDVRTFF